MKYKIVLLFMLFPVVMKAQTDRFLDSCTQEVKRKLIASWTLGIENNSNIVDLKTYNEFKSLFDANATIEDDFNYKLKPLGKYSGTYLISPIAKGFDVYAHDAALEISNLRIDTIAVSFGEWKENTGSIKITRKVWADKARRYLLKDAAALADSLTSFRSDITFEKGATMLTLVESLKENILKNPDSVYRFEYTSTSTITLNYNSNEKLNPVKIIRIENDVDFFSCLNDADKDGVLDAEDSLQHNYGDFTAKGMPDYDFDGVLDTIKGDKLIQMDECKTLFAITKSNHGCPANYFITRKAFEVFAGLQFNAAKINLPALNKLGYVDAAGNSTVDVLQSQKGTLVNPGLVAGVYGGVNFAYYFGKKAKQSGISAGLNYSKFSANYKLSEAMVYTYKTFDGNNFFRRQIEIGKLNEDITYTMVNIPVLFNYRFKLFKKNEDTKWVINLKAGPSLLLFKTTSVYDAAVNVGGLYQVDTIAKDKITYYDYFTPGSTYNVNLTAGSLNSQNPNPGADNVFSQLYANSSNYDFATKTFSGKQQLARKLIAFNLNVDGQKLIAEGLALKVGASFVYIPKLGVKEKYKPIDITADGYRSIYNSNANTSFYSLGINVGFVYNW